MKYTLVIIETAIRVVIIAITIIALVFVTSCSTTPVEKIIYVSVTDSTCVDSLIYYREQFRRTKDSLSYTKDFLGEDLFVAKYKLGRIKYYNDIAAKGNNIKYLRGWINRVLNE